MERITEIIQKTPKETGKYLKSKDDIREWIWYITPRIAVYFQTTLGFPFEVFKDKFESMTSLQKLLFCLDQVKKKHYV